MKRTVITVALLAAFAMPAFAGDATMKNDDATTTARVDATTATVKQQSDMSPTAVKSGAYHGCAHRSSTLEMM
jgi:hypothetical protein